MIPSRLIRPGVRLVWLACLWLAALGAQAGMFLWEAARGDDKVMLLGSIHLGRPDFYPLPAPMEAAYRAAGALVVEADVTDQASMAALLPMTLLPDGQTLGSRLTPAQSKRLDAVLKPLGLPRTAAERMKPWFLSLTLTALATREEGMHGSDGIDLHFLQRAHRDGKPVLELESARAQFALFDNLPEADAVRLLDAALLPLEQGRLRSQLNALLDAWQQGDAERLRRVIEEEWPDNDATARRLNELLLTRRNQAMAARIATLAQRQPPLVVVGAGHLVGTDSILRLLEARGFKIKQF